MKRRCWLVRVGDSEKGPWVIHEGHSSKAGVASAPNGVRGTFHIGPVLVTHKRALATEYEDEIAATYVRGFVEAATGEQAWPEEQAVAP